jgi:ABC-type transporter Mla MlaB component
MNGSDIALAVRLGEHACCRFTRAEDRRRAAAAFVRDALERGHKVVYLCDADDADAYAVSLASEDAAIDAAIDRGQVDVRPSRSVYAPDGNFDAERILATWREEHRRALAEGYPALSLTGEMAWAHESAAHGSEQIAEYERRLAEVVAEGDIVVLCQYAQSEFDPGTLSDVAAVHGVDLSPELAALSRSGYLSAARIEGRTLRLAGELDHACADALAAVLEAHFPGPLRLDLADLDFVDVAGMRALRGRTRQPLTIDGASESVLRLVGLLAWDTDPTVRLVEAA